MNLAPIDDLISDIYEAAVIPEKWPVGLDRFTKIGQGAFSSIFTQRGNDIRWVGTPEANSLIGDYVALNKPDLNPRIARFGASLHPGFLSDLDCFSDQELATDPFYKDFLRPRGYGWVASRHIWSPSGDLIVASIERRYERGPFEVEIIAQLDRLAPHIARAGLLAARLQFARVRAMTEALEAIGLPGAVLRRKGQLFSANPSFESTVMPLIEDRNDRLRFVDEQVDELFAASLEAISHWQIGQSISSIPIAASHDRPPIIVHLVPIRGSAQDIFSEALSLLVITPVNCSSVPSAKVLQGLFDLSPAEARVARAIGNAQSVEEIAQAMGVSKETIRSQLKSVLSKTGLNRQVELVSLIAGKALPSG